MARGTFAAAAAAALVVVAGCNDKPKFSTPVGPSGGVVSISASRAAVVANGVNTVTLHVQDTAGGTIALATNRGTFAGGSNTTTVAGGSGDVVLTTCNTAVDLACAGTAVVLATAGTSTPSQVSITFGGLELCSADCSVDAACASHACTLTGGGAGTCSGATPSVCAPPVCAPSPAGSTTEVSCTDGVDNDCSGQIDCADTGCDGQACKSGSPTFLCQSGACTDVSSGLAIQVAPGRTRLPADGVATTPVVVTVTRDGTPQAGMGVTLSTTLGTLSLPTATTGGDGKATVTFTASATSGTATVTAQVTSIPLVAQAADITMPPLGAITLPTGGVQFPVMGVRSSGYREINGIALSLTDDKGLAYPEGLTVRFEHQQLGGSHLSVPATADTATCLAASGCVGFKAATDAGGLARVNLYSGTVAGTLSVVATATAGGVTLNFSVPSVAVIGARANGANFSIDCAPRNLAALADTNCSTSRVDDHFNCEALLKDRFNNLLGTATQVTFVAEAAAVGQVAVTPAYDPSKPPTQQAGLGIATQIFNTLGAGLPFDVAPLPGEPSVVHGLDGCGARTHNPRDGVLTVIAIADGEEAFFDSNGNGVYDLGEPFIDLGEPYVDQNDNGQYDTGEWFLDVNQNGVYDGPSGVWDANTKLWTETVVVYTGVPAGPLDVPEPFTDANGNGAYDPGELFVDVNGNGVYDAAGAAFVGSRWVRPASYLGACEPSALVQDADPTTAPPDLAFDFSVANGPTSASFVVVASDMNLNRLTFATGYSVVVEVPAKTTATYLGLPGYADDYGFFFQFWPCDQAGACASQCRATGGNAPCLMKPAITSLSCGVAASVAVRAASTPDVGGVVVDWKVATTFPVLDGSKTSIYVDSIVGVSGP
jgi:Invasin, domain 3